MTTFWYCVIAFSLGGLSFGGALAVIEYKTALRAQAREADDEHGDD